MAFAAVIFYLLAGARHALQRGRNRLENVAMASGLAAASVLMIYVVIAPSK